MEKVDISSLQEPYGEIAEIIGVEATVAIFNELKGQQITFPARLYKKSYVIKEVNLRYNGGNLKELAMEFNYTERWIRTFINKKQRRVKSELR